MPDPRTPEPRTLVILNDASIARGGATGLALFQARLMRERGLRVVYVAGDEGANPEFAALGIEVRALGARPLMKAGKLAAATLGLYHPGARTHVAEAVAEFDAPDTIFHVHGWSKALSPSIFAALRPVAPRTFIHAHDFFLACPNGGFMDYRAMEPCARVPLSLSCLGTNCDKRSYAQKLWRVGRSGVLSRTLDRGAPWAGILMIHPGMAPSLARGGYPTGRMIALRNPATAFSATRITAEENRDFVFVGRVEAEKGIEDLIAATEAADLPLVVIGDGPLREGLAARYPAVRFTGWMERAQIGAALASARALVMPSRYPEPFGLVAAEASLSGLPVILPQTALLGPEIAAQGLGQCVDTRDPVALAATLKKIAEMGAQELRNLSVHAASGAAGLCLTPEAWIDRQFSLYREALGGGIQGFQHLDASVTGA